MLIVLSYGKMAVCYTSFPLLPVIDIKEKKIKFYVNLIFQEKRVIQ